MSDVGSDFTEIGDLVVVDNDDFTPTVAAAAASA
jgi:hypothetical protein